MTVEPVYGTVIALVRTVWRVQGLRFTVIGQEHIPATGGAVIAINHTGYMDFTLAGLPTFRAAPRAQSPVHGQAGSLRQQDHRADHARVPAHPGGPLERLRVLRRRRRTAQAGELVGVYPEATISRSFEIKEFKSGAARMAIEADVPIIPHIIWGAQRIWTKDHPEEDVPAQGADRGDRSASRFSRRCRHPS